MSLISIDPVTFGARNNCGGWALWTLEARLVACGAYLYEHELRLFNCAEAIIERPNYRGRSSNVNPEDIVRLAFDAGVAAARVAKKVTPVSVKQWKGETPKEVIEYRVRRLLTDKEQKAFETNLETVAASKRHNVIEAVALGLWRFGRMKR